MATDRELDRTDRLVSGTDLPADLLAELGTDEARAVQLLKVLGAIEVHDHARDRERIGAIAGAIRDAVARRARRAGHLKPVRRPTKVAVAGIAILLTTGTAAAAATGSLPAPAQRLVARVLADVKISVPVPPEDAVRPLDPHPPGGTGGPSSSGTDTPSSSAPAAGIEPVTPRDSAAGEPTVVDPTGPAATDVDQPPADEPSSGGASNGSENSGGANDNGVAHSSPNAAKPATKTPSANGKGQGKANAPGQTKKLMTPEPAP